MNQRYLTPGPTQLFDSIPSYIQEGLQKDVFSISHRSKDFEEVVKYTKSELRKLLNIPDDYHIFFLGSATEAMERIIENCVEKHSFHFVNGAFSKRFYQTAVELKKSPQKLEAEFGQGFDFSNLQIPEETELICFTHNETSTGVMTDLNNIYEIKKKYPDKLIALDIVSSAPYATVDYSQIDCSFLSIQKGFGLPAGLGVLIINQKMMDKSIQLNEKGLNIGTYHNFPSLLKKSEKNQTPETPNVFGIFLLGKICNELNEKGIETIRAETEKRAEMLYTYFDSHQSYKPFVKDKESRSKTVISVEIPERSPVIISKLKENGITVGGGYKQFKETQIRIANYPMINEEDINKIIEVLSS
ncbi:aminotransferase class V-fold PLP-dependent enzyme [Nanoarchaeota archaeon]